jgi:ATP-dependent Clp protease ATP-binding subunit ClpB
LLDEIEKAHPDVFNILLQILDDGRLTDGQGRTVDCRNAVFILTSNIGSRYLVEGVENDEIPERVREQVMAELRAGFRPEFLNRIDDIVLFKPLGLKQISAIVDLMISALNKRLEEHRITVELDESAHTWIAENGYDPVYGARPLRRFIQKEIETPLAKAIIGGKVSDGQNVRFTKPKADTPGLKLSAE